MADEFDHAAFWLPQEILTDSDGEISPKFRRSGGRKTSSFGSFDSDGESKPAAVFPFEFPYSETESDEEENLAELTRHLTRSASLTNDESKRFDSVSNSFKPAVSAGSPQSTLCGQGSSRGSPNAPSPPAATWDLLHAAAGEVAKMRIHDEHQPLFSDHNKTRSILGAPRVPSPNQVSDFGYYLHLQQQQQSLSHKHLQFERLRQQQIVKNIITAAMAAQQQSQVAGWFQPIVQNRVMKNNNGPVELSSTIWPPLHQAQQQYFQPNGSRFGGGVVAGAAVKESTGTGVFLPRQVGHRGVVYPRSKKQPQQQQQQAKQASSTAVFVPAKVVQALRSNVDEVRPQPQPQQFNNAFTGGRNNATSDYELALRIRNSGIAMAQQNGSVMRSPPPQQTVVNHEIRLPQEWTY